MITLALGIGANTAMFSMVYGVLLPPLPFKDPGRLYTLWERNLKMGYEQNPPAAGNFRDWRDRNRVFEQVAGVRMGMRRFTRLTNAFSKKLDNLKAAVALHYIRHKTQISLRRMARNTRQEQGGFYGKCQLEVLGAAHFVRVIHTCTSGKPKSPTTL